MSSKGLCNPRAATSRKHHVTHQWSTTQFATTLTRNSSAFTSIKGLRHPRAAVCRQRHITHLCVFYGILALTRVCISTTATHCNTLQHTATHCNTLQHTATHCNTPRHTATHCNTLQRINASSTAYAHILHIRYLPGPGIFHSHKWTAVVSLTSMRCSIVACMSVLWQNERMWRISISQIGHDHPPLATHVNQGVMSHIWTHLVYWICTSTRTYVTNGTGEGRDWWRWQMGVKAEGMLRVCQGESINFRIPGIPTISFQ